MVDKNTGGNLEQIRAQIELLKKRIYNMDKTLSIQETAIDLIDKRAKDFLKEAQLSNMDMSVKEIMKNAFSRKALPGILLK